ncbi:WD repeat-containing protein 44 [Aphanomyces cochlioides]|nr:WD repeat-containing protein 44 [Aphanomyces cochlioides]
MSGSSLERKRFVSDVDESFFDAQEGDVATGINAATAARGALKGDATTKNLESIPEKESIRREETLESVTSTVESTSGDVRLEDIFIVRNKDTGEVYDIRELEANPVVDGYTMFPHNFEPPRDAHEPECPPEKKEMNFRSKIFNFKRRDKSMSMNDGKTYVQVTSSKKEKREFDCMSLLQTLTLHNGTIWTMKFSHDGARLVSGGQDAILRVWKVESLTDAKTPDRLFEETPEQAYEGHTMPIVDVSWSRSNFILSASMDKTVRLWHISKSDCLHVFQHPDSVPAVDFHPKDDRFFLSGCFDNKARIWNIPDGCVVSYVQTPVMITAASFHPSGTRVIAGLLNGQCILYQVNAHQAMNYYTQIECRNARGATRKGRKVTGIEFSPEGKYFLVSTNDSRMRLFSVDNYSRVCKYKGLVNNYLQIKGRFSQDGDYVICGSENAQVYIWTKSAISSSSLLLSHKQDRNHTYESFLAADAATGGVVTVALFAPASTFALVNHDPPTSVDVHGKACTGYIVTASYDGCIKVYERESRAVR